MNESSSIFLDNEDNIPPLSGNDENDRNWRGLLRCGSLHPDSRKL